MRVHEVSLMNPFIIQGPDFELKGNEIPTPSTEPSRHSIAATLRKLQLFWRHVYVITCFVLLSQELTARLPDSHNRLDWEESFSLSTKIFIEFSLWRKAFLVNVIAAKLDIKFLTIYGTQKLITAISATFRNLLFLYGKLCVKLTRWMP
jgi:hypothetical protein